MIASELALNDAHIPRNEKHVLKIDKSNYFRAAVSSIFKSNYIRY